MSHTTIYFLVQAEDEDRAESKADAYLEAEHFYDYFTILPEESGPLVNKRLELMDFIRDWDWVKNADSFLCKAEKFKESGDLRLYGHHLIYAGELYAQNLTIDTHVYNMEFGNYIIPDEDSGWWVIAIDFHS
jgi:hypothetical protein